MAKTRAQLNKSIRQEALREQLAEQCRLQHIIEGIGKIDELAAIKVADFDTVEEYVASVGTAKDKTVILKAAIDSRLKLLNKYLPDLKSVELSGDGEGPVVIIRDLSGESKDDNS